MNPPQRRATFAGGGHSSTTSHCKTKCFTSVIILALGIWSSAISEAHALLLRGVYSDVSAGGVTALFHIASKGEVVLGTKRGLVYLVDSLAQSNSFQYAWLDRKLVSEDKETPTKRSFPVYSIDSTRDGSILFCGAGDRYVSIWKRKDSGWERGQNALGPHTGWVKDLVVNQQQLHEHHQKQQQQQQQLLHSIGCNCIETWAPADNDSGEWVHRTKSTIESSPTDGCTLSSDLLCLALSNGQLLAGGVDGRIHVWESESMNKDNISFPAHMGRVNALATTPGQELIVSGGSDGKLRCWHLSDASRPISSWDFGNDVRITAVSCFTHGADTFVLVGTQVGEIFLLDLRDESQSELQKLRLEDDPMVYGFCILPAPITSGPREFLVGHARGLCIVQLDQE